MGYSYGSRSNDVLSTLHPKLQLVFNTVILYYDCSLLEGHRDKQKQELYFDEGLTTLHWPDSKHNQHPSLAVDAVPYPLPDNWGKDDKREWAKFYHFAGFVLGVGASLNIPLRWGGDWDGDKNFSDQNFHDLPHFELIGE